MHQVCQRHVVSVMQVTCVWAVLIPVRQRMELPERWEYFFLKFIVRVIFLLKYFYFIIDECTTAYQPTVLQSLSKNHGAMTLVPAILPL